MVGGGGGYIFSVGEWWWMVVDIFWLVVGSDGWRWVVVSGGRYILIGVG